MNLRVNGDLITVPEEIKTITELIKHFQIQNPVVIVEHNHMILEKEEHAKVKVSDGDKIELVQFVGGG